MVDWALQTNYLPTCPSHVCPCVYPSFSSSPSYDLRGWPGVRNQSSIYFVQSDYPSFCLSICPSVFLFVWFFCPSVRLSVCMGFCPSVRLSVRQGVGSTFFLSVCLSVLLFVCLCVRASFFCVSVCPAVLCSHLPDRFHLPVCLSFHKHRYIFHANRQ